MIFFLKTAMASKKTMFMEGKTCTVVIIYTEDQLLSLPSCMVVWESFPSITTVSDDTMSFLTHVMNKCFETHGNNSTAGA